MKFIFIGGSYRGYEVFKALTERNHIPAVAFILQEDGHEQLNYSDAMARLAQSMNIPFFIKKKLSKADEEWIATDMWDFAIVCGWRTIINPGLNRFLKLGMVAAHDSLLPKYRGFAPMNWAMINGERETGVTLFIINEDEVDSGDIIAQGRAIIENEDYAIDVQKKITAITISLYLQFINDYESGDLNPVKQDNAAATYTCKRTPEDGRIDWSRDSGSILNFIRALAPPYPGAFCFYNDRSYIIHKAVTGKWNSCNYVMNIPGRVLKTEQNGIEVMCGSGSIFITLWEDVATGTVCAPNDIVKSITATLK